jgi:hypothetical protein
MKRERELFTMEIGQSFSWTRLPLAVMLTLGGIWLVVQRGELSPFVTILLVVFAVQDEQFNNFLYRSPNEFEALRMFVLPWRRVVLVKNLAALTTTFLLFWLIAASVMFFSPVPPSLLAWGEATVYGVTIIFPLLCLGNVRSVQEPRRDRGRLAAAAGEALGVVVIVLVLSIPFVLFSTVLHAPEAALAYAAAGMIAWIRFSIPFAARVIQKKGASICEQA